MARSSSAFILKMICGPLGPRIPISASDQGGHLLRAGYGERRGACWKSDLCRVAGEVIEKVRGVRAEVRIAR